MAYIGASPAPLATAVDSNAVETGDIQNSAVTTAKIADAAVTDAKIDTVAASKLTGALPAIDGSALTGIDSLPSQTGNSGKYLTTDGTNASWATVSIPSEIITPVNSSPANGATGQLETPTLSVSAFYSLYGFTHAASQWQISTASDFSSTVISTGDDASNKTSYTISSGVLSTSTTYYWRVRFKDSNGSYSSWSSAFNFTTTSLFYSAPVVTGGTITTDGDYKVHTFTSSGTFSVSSLGSGYTDPGIASVLIVAGGGGSGAHWGGGGGAGGIWAGTKTFTTTSYSITVGGGGAGQTGNGQGANGGNSSAFEVTAYGGGGSGSENGLNGSNGGSGGGAGSQVNQSGGGGAPTRTSEATGEYGEAGGSSNAWGSGRQGGGGGGASGAGGTGNTGVGGNGGNGYTSSISGSSVVYGGGGGGYGQSTRGTGGTGGGGNGSGGGNTATNGTANRGGGAGGVGEEIASGGSGIVIIRYRFQ